MSIKNQNLASGPKALGNQNASLVPVYVCTMLLSASLLFLVQPMFARMALPLLRRAADRVGVPHPGARPGSADPAGPVLVPLRTQTRIAHRVVARAGQRC